jgi:hypothetical protein
VAWWVWPRHGASGIVAAWRAAAACLGTVRDERLDRIVELGELVEGHPRGRHIGSMLPNSFITGDRHQVSRGSRIRFDASFLRQAEAQRVSSLPGAVGCTDWSMLDTYGDDRAN